MRTTGINVTCFAGRVTDSTRVTGGAVSGTDGWDSGLGWQARSPLSPGLGVSHPPLPVKDPLMASGRFQVGATLKKGMAVWNPA